jgi:hypothetical protein
MGSPDKNGAILAGPKTATYFVNKDPGQGFDPGLKGSLPWQMLPLGGTRGIKLMNGRGLDIRIESHKTGQVSNGITFTETEIPEGPHRELLLQGNEPGRYRVCALAPCGPTPIAILQTEVFPERIIRIAAFFLPVDVSHITEQRADEWNDKLSKIEERVNNIFMPQANIKVTNIRESKKAWNPGNKPCDARAPINLQDENTRQALWRFSMDIMPKDPPPYDLLMYFCGKILGGDTNGECVYTYAVIDLSKRSPDDDGCARVARTIAHEIGHFCTNNPPPGVTNPFPANRPSPKPHDEDKNDLMIDGDNTVIRRERCCRMHWSIML